jgi:hypothetical protein
VVLTASSVPHEMVQERAMASSEFLLAERGRYAPLSDSPLVHAVNSRLRLLAHSSMDRRSLFAKM